jgi:hypothetical protein
MKVAPGITSIAEYLESLPEDRRAAIQKVRALVKKHLPKGYVEGYQSGFITWAVPLKIYPDTYNGQALPYACLASQKNHMALYLMNVYMHPKLLKGLTDGFKAAGKKLDMGKSCLRFKRLDDLALEPIADVIGAIPMDEYIAYAKKVHGEKK